jgi:hypothetical protein
MPLGDADIASGVFFAEFGVSVVFGAQPAAKGILDAPGKDSQFGDQLSVSNQEYRLEVAGVAFAPFPGPGDLLIVDGQRYKVESASPDR